MNASTIKIGQLASTAILNNVVSNLPRNTFFPTRCDRRERPVEALFVPRSFVRSFVRCLFVCSFVRFFLRSFVRSLVFSLAPSFVRLLDKSFVAGKLNLSTDLGII